MTDSRGRSVPVAARMKAVRRSAIRQLASHERLCLNAYTRRASTALTPSIRRRHSYVFLKVIVEGGLLRFGSELLFQICQFFGVEVVVLDAATDVSREQQLT